MGARSARAVLAALAALAAVAPRAAARDLFGAAGGTVELGLLFPLEDSGRAADEPNQWRAAFDVALLAVNADPALLPNHTLVGVTVDHKHSSDDALLAAADVIDTRGVAALVGPAKPQYSTAVGFVAGARGVNVVDPLATLSSLADQERYPTVHRLPASGTQQALAVLAMAAHLGWTSVGIVHDNEINALDIAHAALASASRFGVEVVEVVQVHFESSLVEGQESSDALGSINIALERIRSTLKTRVWLHLVGLEHSLEFLKITGEAGLRDPGYHWLVPPATAPLPIHQAIPYVSFSEIYFEGAVYEETTAAHDAWEAVLVQRMYNQTEVPGGGQFIDTFSTRWCHDAVRVAATALDALWRLHDSCGGGSLAPNPQFSNCTELAADAGDDDASLRRAIRTIAVTEGLLGAPVVLDPQLGGRTVPMLVAQLEFDVYETAIDPLRGVVMPFGSQVIDYEKWKWAGGGREPTDVPPGTPSVVEVLAEAGGATFDALTVLLVIGIAAALLLAVFTCVHRNHPAVRMSSYRFNLLSTAGLAMAMAAPAGLHFGRTTATCSSGTFLLSIGIVLSFSPMVAKLWRVYRIFSSGSLKAVSLPDRRLLPLALGPVVLVTVLFGLWEALDPMGTRTELQGGPRATDDPLVLHQTVVRTCARSWSKGLVAAYAVLLGAMLVAGCALAVLTRNVAVPGVNDSGAVGGAVYVLTLCLVVSLPVLAGVESAHTRLMVLAVSMLVLGYTTLTLLHGPKVLEVYGIATGSATVAPLCTGTATNSDVPDNGGIVNRGVGARRGSFRAGGGGGGTRNGGFGRGSVVGKGPVAGGSSNGDIVDAVRRASLFVSRSRDGGGARSPAPPAVARPAGVRPRRSIRVRRSQSHSSISGHTALSGGVAPPPPPALPLMPPPRGCTCGAAGDAAEPASPASPSSSPPAAEAVPLMSPASPPPGGGRRLPPLSCMGAAPVPAPAPAPSSAASRPEAEPLPPPGDGKHPPGTGPAAAAAAE